MDLVAKIEKIAKEMQARPSDKKLLKELDRHITSLTNTCKAFQETRTCRQCGNCCRAFWIEVSDDDLNREPRLKDRVIPINDVPPNVRGSVGGRGEQWVIPKTKGNQCPFLIGEKNDTLCSIYDTRPDACRNFIPSAFLCQCAFLDALGGDMAKTSSRLKSLGIPTEVIIYKIMQLTGIQEEDEKYGWNYERP